MAWLVGGRGGFLFALFSSAVRAAFYIHLLLVFRVFSSFGQGSGGVVWKKRPRIESRVSHIVYKHGVVIVSSAAEIGMRRFGCRFIFCRFRFAVFVDLGLVGLSPDASAWTVGFKLCVRDSQRAVTPHLVTTPLR
ncbi:hypothetical protein BKA81DRAFT_198781 [Phyllosticta paracitricarpa]